MANLWPPLGNHPREGQKAFLLLTMCGRTGYKLLTLITLVFIASTGFYLSALVPFDVPTCHVCFIIISENKHSEGTVDVDDIRNLYRFCVSYNYPPPPPSPKSLLPVCKAQVSNKFVLIYHVSKCVNGLGK